MEYVVLHAVYHAWVDGEWESKAECARFLKMKISTFKYRLDLSFEEFGYPAAREPKVLLWDLELTQDLSAHYGFYNINSIPMCHNLRTQRVLTAAWQWFDEENTNPIESVNILDDKKRWKKNNWDIRKKLTLDDYHPVSVMREKLKEADLIIAHNGDRFDRRHINAHIIRNKLPRIQENTSVDTLKIAKKHFFFPSNGLDNLCDYLGLVGKVQTPRLMMYHAGLGDEVALRELEAYNRGDIAPSLRGLYLKLRPYITNHPNRNARREKIGCKCCPAIDTIKLLAKERWCGSKTKPEFQCSNCENIMTFTVDELKRWNNQNGG